jgi:BirA family transcriptional regulator, biotin operon repressor / biotin---[acetyl-CoA-carboxylase] ligase
LPVVNGFFNILTSVDSTNNYAMAMVHAGTAAHGMAWFAREQTAGRGQRGRQWLAEPGQNIALSVVLEPLQLKTNQQFMLSMLVGLACHDFFAAFAGDETFIKWPNDLYWRDRKAGGVLIENAYHGRLWKQAVVGMGININQVVFAPELKNPVSLRQITGKTFDAEDLARQLHQLLVTRFNTAEKTGYAGLETAYNQRLYKRNQPVKLKKENQVFETTIDRVTADGLLHTHDVLERSFGFGEVEFV